MGIQQPFLYDAVKSDSLNSFDPKAVTRASMTPKPPRPKQTGPLISFNQHPDSYLILPHGLGNAHAMSGSVKAWVKWMRIFQLVLRCLEFLCAVGLLVMLIMIKGMDITTGWVMRPGVAVLHTVYGVYHLARKASGRTPASSAAYMLFASFFDVSIFPFYGFSALVAKTRQSNWSILLSNQDLTPIFTTVAFYLSAAGSGMHLISLAVSIYLAVTFRKITMLPPDMNPLEDNLTSRHRRNKSSISTATDASEKRFSTPLESKRSSGAAYESLSRPPTIPFFHTRSNSTESFSTYRSTPPPSRDSRLDLPSRQYQVVGHSPRSSLASTSDLKRSSGYGPSQAPKRSSYTEVPTSKSQSQRSPVHASKPGDGWYAADSLNSRNRNSSPQKARYQPLQQQHDSQTEIQFSHPNPLEANPPTPRLNYNNHRDSPLSQISHNRGSGDIADDRSRFRDSSPQRDIIKTKQYGELKPGTPPIMIGGNSRQVSSGTDFAKTGSNKFLNQRGVSGKIAEEGRGGGGAGWGSRFRKISGPGGL